MDCVLSSGYESLVGGAVVANKIQHCIFYGCTGSSYDLHTKKLITGRYIKPDMYLFILLVLC